MRLEGLGFRMRIRGRGLAFRVYGFGYSSVTREHGSRTEGRVSLLQYGNLNSPKPGGMAHLHGIPDTGLAAPKGRKAISECVAGDAVHLEL